MFWRWSGLRTVAMVIVICLMGVWIRPTEALTFSYYSEFATDFDSGSGGFTLSGNCTWTGDSLIASGKPAEEAKASKTFSQIIPPFRITFDIKITSYLNGSLPLEFTYVRFGSSPNVEIRLFRSTSGKLAVQTNSSAISETKKAIRMHRWQSITLLYDPSTPKIQVNLNGSKAYSSTETKVYLNESLIVSLGILELPGKSNGEALFDNFDLQLSPLIEAERPMNSPGDTVYLVGHQLSANSDIDVVVTGPGGSTVESFTVESDASGWFRSGFNLSTTARAGKYKVSAEDPVRGEVQSSFGVWKCSSKTVQRAESFTLSGGGLRASTTFNMKIYRTDVYLEQLSLTASAAGSFSFEVELDPDVEIGSYTAKISGTGTADYPSTPFSDTLSFEVIAAGLNINVLTDSSVYNRTQTMRVTAEVTYPNGDRVPTSTSVQLRLYHGPALVLVSSGQMSYSSSAKKWSWFHTFSSSSKLGNYTIAVTAEDIYGNTGSGNNSVTVEHAPLTVTIYGLNAAYQRTEAIDLSALIEYPDTSLVTLGIFKMHLRGPDGVFREATIHYDPDSGRWGFREDAPYVIPVDETTGSWVVTVRGTDIFGNQGEKISAITIERAGISVLDISLNSSYHRTSKIALSARALYPGGTTLSIGRVVATLSVSTGKKYEFTFSYTPTESIWAGEIVIGRDYAVGRATLNLSASDPYLNSGFWTGSLNITLAVLNVAVEAEREGIQIGFDSVTFVGNITYPDGSPLTSGTVFARIAAGNALLKSLNLTYTHGVGWSGVYTPSIFDPSGLYLISITAHDAYGNSGQRSLRVNASQALLIGVIVMVLLAITIGFVLWFRSRRGASPYRPIELGP